MALSPPLFLMLFHKGQPLSVARKALVSLILGSSAQNCSLTHQECSPNKLTTKLTGGFSGKESLGQLHLPYPDYECLCISQASSLPLGRENRKRKEVNGSYVDYICMPNSTITVDSSIQAMIQNGVQGRHKLLQLYLVLELHFH